MRCGERDSRFVLDGNARQMLDNLQRILGEDLLSTECLTWQKL
jgi:hypothetical protein